MLSKFNTLRRRLRVTLTDILLNPLSDACRHLLKWQWLKLRNERKIQSRFPWTITFLNLTIFLFPALVYSILFYSSTKRVGHFCMRVRENDSELFLQASPLQIFCPCKTTSTTNCTTIHRKNAMLNLSIYLSNASPSREDHFENLSQINKVVNFFFFLHYDLN